MEILKNLPWGEIVAALFTAVLIPFAGKLGHWLWVWLSAQIEKIKIDQIRQLVYTLVRAAAQGLPGASNSDKFDYVAEQLHAKFPWLPKEQAADFIEAAVLQLKQDIAAYPPVKKNQPAGSVAVTAGAGSAGSPAPAGS